MDKITILHDVYNNDSRDLVESNFRKIFKNWGNVLDDSLLYTLCMDEKLKPTLEYNKRMRPFLVWLSSNAAGLQRSDVFWELSTVVELIHQCTLPADDIQDDSEFRCWRLALWKKVWTGTAINLILLLALSWWIYYAKTSSWDNTWNLHNYSDFLFTTAFNLVYWQQLDLSANDDLRSIKDYYNIVDGKTWALINLSLHFWTMPYQELYTEEKSQALTRFSMLLARLYQIKDDVDDVNKNKKLDPSNIYYYVDQDSEKLNSLCKNLREELFIAHDKLKQLKIVKYDYLLDLVKVLLPEEEFKFNINKIE